MSKFEVSNFIKAEPNKSEINSNVDTAKESIEKKELNEKSTLKNSEGILDPTDNQGDELIDINEMQLDLDSLICNLDLNSLMNKYLNLDEYSKHIENLESAQDDLYEMLIDLSKKVELHNNERFVMFREKTKVYY